MRRQLLLVLGMSILVAAFAYGCGDDVSETSGSSNDGGGGSGGMGGAPASTGANPTTGGAGGVGGAGGSTGPGDPCPGPFDNTCDEACCGVEVACGFMGACGIAGSVLGIDLDQCADMRATCSAACLIQADCGAIASLAGNMPDQALSDCLGQCSGPCIGCAQASCGVEATACLNDQTQVCPGFVSCAANCPDGDGACVTACAAANDNQLTQDLVACVTTACPMECGLGGGVGGGGQGGQGGN